MNWPQIIEDDCVYQWSDGQHRWIYVGDVVDGKIVPRPRLPWWRRCRWEWVLVMAINTVCLLVGAYMTWHIYQWITS